ncbi:Ras guanine nucleotide exchange factor bud5, partial [Rhizina undulata]
MTMDETNYSQRSSIYVAPLRIDKTKSTSTSSRKPQPRTSRHSQQRSSSAQSGSSSHRQITPPPTPNTSQDSLQANEQQTPPPQHHRFLRAFFPFHPTLTPDSSTITLPLNSGDVIMVHSVHTNGWADGTMMSSGARGWLPTNYCKGYEMKQICMLLKACLIVFDLFRGQVDLGVRASQNAVTGVVAGVRNLLETTGCLTREAPTVKSNNSIRKSRKLLLTELSNMVKTAKRLPGHSDDGVQIEATEDLTDEIILRTFKIVLRGVKFLDIWYDQHEEEQKLEEEALQAGDMDESVPPTPPADSSIHSGVSSAASLHAYPASETNTDNTVSKPQSSTRHHQQPSPTPPNLASERRDSHPLPSTPYSQNPRAASPPLQNNDTVFQHAQSNQSVDCPAQPVYALARLNTMHDVLLSYLGSYIGRLYNEPRFTAQLQLTQSQSVSAARELLAIVEIVHARDNRAIALASAKEAMYYRISALVNAAREVVAGRIEDADDDEGIVIPDDGRRLVDAATGCVRGAGECVAKASLVIDRIGDFELGSFGIGLGITTSFMDDYTPTKLDVDRDSMPPPPTPEKIPPRPPPKEDVPVEKPLPTLPPHAPLKLNTSAPTSPTVLIPPTPETAEQSPTGLPSRESSPSSLLPPLPQLTPLECAAVENIRKRDAEAKTLCQKSTRTNSVATIASIIASEFTNSFRGSEFSILSQTSTRATTPEPLSSTTIATPILNADLAASQTSLVSGGDAVDKTHADDLTFNKEGQITGGTLPALIERLTVHDATPDAVFVATFYLTFRLFTTPKELAEALVERFDSVANNLSGAAAPVHLRVYNVLKGWLESHWRNSCDHEALEAITGFASGKLKEVLPPAGKRLEALAQKVSSVDGPLVPRLVCGFGKTANATSQATPPETPIPSPSVTRNQLSILKNALAGGPAPSILDFDPLELARQLTLKESRMFCSILPEELLAQEWTKKKGSSAPNVRAMSTLSTDLAHLVAESILDVADPKRRAVVIKHWIKVADRCLELNNYDSLMAIMCTMNTSTIVRLKKTWELVSPKTRMVLENLRSVIDVSKNHAVLRARLRNHVPPCLPFLGTYLTDLTFIDVGNPSKRPISVDGSTKQLINFDKYVKTARIISELQRFQIPYRIYEVQEMQQWIDAEMTRVHNSSSGDVQQLYRRSLLLEPRETPQPKPIDTTLAAIPPPPPPPP